MSGEAGAPESQAQRAVGARVRGELIDYRVHGTGDWTRYRVTAQWRRRSHIWWNATAVATGERACLAIDVRNEGAVWRRVTAAEEWADEPDDERPGGVRAKRGADDRISPGRARRPRTDAVREKAGRLAAAPAKRAAAYLSPGRAARAGAAAGCATVPRAAAVRGNTGAGLRRNGAKKARRKTKGSEDVRRRQQGQQRRGTGTNRRGPTRRSRGRPTRP